MRNGSHLARFATAALLVGLASGFSVPGEAAAAANADFLIDVINCNAVCDADLESCVAPCCISIICGRLCSRRCASPCQDAAAACKSNCSTLGVGGQSDGAFYDTATLARNGRVIGVGGPFSCPDTATVDLNVTLTQRGVGAVGTGATQFRCPVGGETTFSLSVHTEGDAVRIRDGRRAPRSRTAGAKTSPTRFQPFQAVQACGSARIHAGGQGIDSFQWCRDITVIPEGVEIVE